jgi:hypothetical protein
MASNPRADAPMQAVNVGEKRETSRRSGSAGLARMPWM